MSAPPPETIGPSGSTTTDSNLGAGVPFSPDFNPVDPTNAVLTNDPANASMLPGFDPGIGSSPLDMSQLAMDPSAFSSGDNQITTGAPVTSSAPGATQSAPTAPEKTEEAGTATGAGTQGRGIGSGGAPSWVQKLVEGLKDIGKGGAQSKGLGMQPIQYLPPQQREQEMGQPPAQPQPPALPPNYPNTSGGMFPEASPNYNRQFPQGAPTPHPRPPAPPPTPQVAAIEPRQREDTMPAMRAPAGTPGPPGGPLDIMSELGRMLGGLLGARPQNYSETATQAGYPQPPRPPQPIPQPQPQPQPASLTRPRFGMAPGQIGIPANTFAAQSRPSGRPTQPNVDRSSFRSQITDPNVVRKMAWMVNGEIGRNAPIQAKIIQLETLFNRAQMRGQNLNQVLWSTSENPNHGYYQGGPQGTYGARNAPSGAEIAAFQRDVLGPVMKGSNYSDIGWGPMTGNASGKTAADQFRARQIGYKVHGGDYYFREGPLRRLPTMQTIPAG
jgi:hypothetical protein